MSIVKWWNNPCFWGHDFEAYEEVRDIPRRGPGGVLDPLSVITRNNEVCLRCGETGCDWNLVKEQRLNLLREQAVRRETRRTAAILMVLANEAQKRGEYE